MKSGAFAAALLACTCASVELGRDFDPSAFDAKVVRGKTTRDDVRAWLGAPAGVGAAIESDGERLERWTYYRAEGRLQELKTRAGFLASRPFRFARTLEREEVHDLVKDPGRNGRNAGQPSRQFRI